MRLAFWVLKTGPKKLVSFKTSRNRRGESDKQRKGVVMDRDKLIVESVSVRAKDGLLAIQNLNLEKVLTKLQKPSPRGKGWTADEAATADKWYRRFLTIGLKNPGVVIVPNEPVDELWHAHILNMRQYEADTKRIFGGILYHTPTFGECDLKPHFAKTNELLRAEFGEDLTTSGDYEPKSCCCPEDFITDQARTGVAVAA